MWISQRSKCLWFGTRVSELCLALWRLVSDPTCSPAPARSSRTLPAWQASLSTELPGGKTVCPYSGHMQPHEIPGGKTVCMPSQSLLCSALLTSVPWLLFSCWMCPHHTSVFLLLLVSPPLLQGLHHCYCHCSSSSSWDVGLGLYKTP